MDIVLYTGEQEEFLFDITDEEVHGKLIYQNGYMRFYKVFWKT